MARRKAKPPPGAPHWWPGVQLRLFEPTPHQPGLFDTAAPCGCAHAPGEQAGLFDPAELAPKKRRKRKESAA